MIVIPMAGMSSRFFKAGYTKPKYMLEAHGQTLFSHSINSFRAYFQSKPFLFVVRNVYNTPAFVVEQAKLLGIKEFYISVLDSETRGQAETVYLGLIDIEKQGCIQSSDMTVFNIDTFRNNFEYPDITSKCDGYLEVFEGNGDNWSFAKPESDNSTKVIKTAEKKPISNLCSTGLYYFSSIQVYIDTYLKYVGQPKDLWEKGELYIAPLYNFMIKEGLNIHYNKIDRKEVTFCGVPEEYINFLGEDYLGN